MITLSELQTYLSSSEPEESSRPLNNYERYLREQLAGLSSQTEMERTEQLADVLQELRVMDISDNKRMELTAIVIGASESSIVALRQHYISEVGVLTDVQMKHVAQVKSLYYLILMIYEGVIRRNTAFITNDSMQLSGMNLMRYLSNEKPSSTTLSLAIYQALSFYQKLLGEESLSYQKPSSYLWSRINRLYYLAQQQSLVDTDIGLNASIRKSYAKNIHRLYCQICLYSLLNVRMMRRSHILLLQRLLPDWAEHVIATIEPQTQTRVFVDLCKDEPPSYWTARSDINPYEKRYKCLFIELSPVVEHIQARMQVLEDEFSKGVEARLLNNVSMLITYRYLRLQSLPSKHVIINNAVLISGFNDIHYRVSGSRSFARLITAQDLPDEQRPHYDTFTGKNGSQTVLDVESLDSRDALSLFQRLRLAPKAESTLDSRDASSFKRSIVGQGQSLVNKESNTDKKVSSQQPSYKKEVGRTTALVPFSLQVMSLFLLCRSDATVLPEWSMGIVRWIDMDSEKTEVEWQILGHQIVACGLRLDGMVTRGRHFVPAFIVGKDEQIQTTASLIVPTSHFQVNDRVVMCVDNQQTSLQIVRSILTTHEFSQYEVVQI
ncbi:MAG: hypothetical protein ACTH23_02785 [Moraxellaceae bacterium]|uniref:hypothetical protein n=1 Tax=Psychrobacter sp. TaxID=56811 RepID=UPI003F9B2F15